MHHILAEVIQGGLVLETNVDEIAEAGAYIRLIFVHSPLGDYDHDLRVESSNPAVRILLP